MYEFVAIMVLFAVAKWHRPVRRCPTVLYDFFALAIATCLIYDYTRGTNTVALVVKIFLVFRVFITLY